MKRYFCLKKLQKTHGKCVRDIITRMSDGRGDDVVARKALVANYQENYFIGKPAKDLLNCDKHLLSEVTLRISFRRPTNDFVVFSESNKHYKIKIIEANLYVRKLTLADQVFTATEKTLIKHLPLIAIQRFCHDFF